MLSTHMPLITAVMESAGVDIREARGQGKHSAGRGNSVHTVGCAIDVPLFCLFALMKIVVYIVIL